MVNRLKGFGDQMINESDLPGDMQKEFAALGHMTKAFENDMIELFDSYMQKNPRMIPIALGFLTDFVVIGLLTFMGPEKGLSMLSDRVNHGAKNFKKMEEKENGQQL